MNFQAQNRRHRNRQLPRSLRLEALAKRELMAADIALGEDGLLTINGTDASDQILVRNLNSTTLEASVSNADGTLRRSFARADVNGLVIVGLAGNDVITNDTVFASLIDGGAGDDTIRGGDSDDLIFGSLGNDTLYGHQGNDVIDGGAGNDRIEGGSGDDTMYGGEGNDRLEGNSGQDNLSGGDGNDQLYGNGDRDVLDGGAGVDHVNGGDGRDVLLRGDGLDTLKGGSGDDEWIDGSFVTDSLETAFENVSESVPGKHEFTLDKKGPVTVFHAESDNHVRDDSARIGGEVTLLEYSGDPQADSPAGTLFVVISEVTGLEVTETITIGKLDVHAGGDKQGNVDLGAGATAGERAYETTGEAGRARFGVSAGAGAGVRSYNDENGYGFGFDYGPVSMDLQLNEVAAKEWADKVDGTFSNGWAYTKSGGESAIGWVGKKTRLW